MQYTDIKNDIAFRKIFGNENKKEIFGIFHLLVDTFSIKIVH